MKFPNSKNPKSRKIPKIQKKLIYIIVKIPNFKNPESREIPKHKKKRESQYSIKVRIPIIWGFRFTTISNPGNPGSVSGVSRNRRDFEFRYFRNFNFFYSPEFPKNTPIPEVVILGIGIFSWDLFDVRLFFGTIYQKV